MNGDEVKVRHGDKVITLEDQLTRMNGAIRRLEIASVILILLVIISVFITDEQALSLISGVLAIFGGD